MCVGGNGLTESEVIAKYEIMDGLPVRGKTCVFKAAVRYNIIQTVNLYLVK